MLDVSHFHDVVMLTELEEHDERFSRRVGVRLGELSAVGGALAVASPIMGALSGIRVLDVGLLVQGPQAAALLADLGAEVIKVELPGFGDQARWIPATYGHRHSGYYVACNRGKRGVTIDLRMPSGRDVFLRLADTSDVVISNFKPGTMDSWGVGYADTSARNPRIVYGMGSAFGSLGPDADREGADLAGQAAGGLVSTTGVDDGDPTTVGATIADHMSSQHLAAGVLAALFARERTGRGQLVEVSLLGGQIWAQASEYTSYFLSGKVPGRANGGHPLINGSYGMVPTKDGWIAIVGVTAPVRAAFAEAIGLPNLWDDPRFESPIITEPRKRELLALLATAFVQRTTAEWCSVLRSVGVRYAPVRDYAEVAADPQVWDNGYLVKGSHPTLGEVTMVGSPLRMSDTPTTPSIVAPELGQHTEEVLLELGYEWETIAELRAEGAI